jgi:hypothetical protein
MGKYMRRLVADRLLDTIGCDSCQDPGEECEEHYTVGCALCELPAATRSVSLVPLCRDCANRLSVATDEVALQAAYTARWGIDAPMTFGEL